MSYYKCKYFQPYELVPEKINSMIENERVKYSMFDIKLLIFIDWARERYGGLTVNDYMWGGTSQWRGIRTPDSKYYSSGSMHSFGQAIDFIPGKLSAREVIEDLKKLNQILGVPHITRVEDLDGMTWVHVDTKNTNKKGVHFFKP
jgi:hypothetical protein